MNPLLIKLRQEQTIKEQEELERAKGNIVIENTFDEEKFDNNIAHVVRSIHSQAKYNHKNRAYKRWCVDNLSELKNMYLMAEMDCDFNDFCSFVFQSN